MTAIPLRTQPHDKLAEALLLGALMRRPDRFQDAVGIGRGSFYVETNRILWDCLATTQERAGDSSPFVVFREYESRGHSRLTYQDLDSMADRAHRVSVASTSREVIRLARLRQLSADAFEIHDRACDIGEDPEALALELEGRLYGVQSGVDVMARKAQPVVNFARAYCDNLRVIEETGSDPAAVATGYAGLDEILTVRRSNLVILAGRPGMGKTAMSLEIAAHIAVTAGPVLFASLEMSGEELTARLFAQRHRVDYEWARNPAKYVGQGHDYTDFVGKVVNSQRDLANVPLFVDDAPSQTPGMMLSRGRAVKNQRGLAAVFVDYLQLMESGERGQARQEQVEFCSRRLKLMAKELEVPVFALSQLNRECEKRKNKRPVLSDLRGSGAIEQDADVVVFLYRPGAYGEDKRGCEVIVAKQRGGKKGEVELPWTGKFQTFRDLT